MKFTTNIKALVNIMKEADIMQGLQIFTTPHVKDVFFKQTNFMEGYGIGDIKEL